MLAVILSFVALYTGLVLGWYSLHRSREALAVREAALAKERTASLDEARVNIIRVYESTNQTLIDAISARTGLPNRVGLPSQAIPLPPPAQGGLDAGRAALLDIAARIDAPPPNAPLVRSFAAGQFSEGVNGHAAGS